MTNFEPTSKNSSSSAWKAFVASSYVHQNKDKNPTATHQHYDAAVSGGSLFGLQQALSSTSPNTSGVTVGGGNASSPSSSSSKLPSFFIGKKDDLLPNSSNNRLSSSNNKVVALSATKMRDIALKHLFQPELITSSSSAMTMESFLPRASSNTETRYVSSFGVTPLKTAPLRLGVRKRLGVALLNQKKSSSSSRSPTSQDRSTSRSPYGDEDEDQNQNEEQEEHRMREDYNTRLLKHLASRVLSSSAPIAASVADKNNLNDNHKPSTSPLPPPKSTTSAALNTASSTIAGSDPSRRSHYYENENENEDETEMHRRHIEEATQRAKSLSYSELYEESIKRERELEEQKKTDEEGDFQTRLKNLQREQEELEKRKMFDEQDVYEIAGSNTNQTSASRQRTDERLFSENINKATTTTSAQNQNQNKKQQRQVDKTGDFKTPLTLARQSLQQCYQSLEEEHGIPASQVSHIAKTFNPKTPPQTRQATSTVNYLQNKMDSLRMVANKIEQEEHKMRLATATILAEILSLKNLEGAAKSEALSWVEYGQDVREEAYEENDENNGHSSDNNQSRLLEAEEVEAVARDFLIDLE